MKVPASTSITVTGPPQATRTPPTGAPASFIARLLIWFQPWTVPRSSLATIWRTSVIPDGIVRPLAIPNEMAIASRTGAPWMPDDHARAPSTSTPASPSCPATSSRRGS